MLISLYSKYGISLLVWCNLYHINSLIYIPVSFICAVFSFGEVVLESSILYHSLNINCVILLHHSLWTIDIKLAHEYTKGILWYDILTEEIPIYLWNFFSNWREITIVCPPMEELKWKCKMIQSPLKITFI